MVGYDSKRNLRSLDYAIAGAGSGCFTRMLCQPFDVLKIRFQLQIEPIKTGAASSKYTSLGQATNLIIQEEGVKALWKGHISGQLLSISYGFAQFTSFEMLTHKASSLNLSTGATHAINFVCGSLSGCIATVVSFPFDVIRTRMVAQSEQLKIYSSFVNTFLNISKTEGYLVLYRGILPTFIQIAPHAGVQFMTYKMFDSIYRHIFNSNGTTTLFCSLLSGSLAGFCAKISIYPLDLAKKRMQIQGMKRGGRRMFGEEFTCTGLVNCLTGTFRKEGFFGFFKGLSPSLLKAVFASALHFSSYEMICQFIENIQD